MNRFSLRNFLKRIIQRNKSDEEQLLFKPEAKLEVSETPKPHAESEAPEVMHPVELQSEKSEAPEGILGVDMEKGLSYLAGDEKLYEDILETYIEGYQERIDKLTESKQNKDIKSYEIAIHGLKSISASIGADDFAETAYALEKACALGENAMDYIEEKHDQMVAEYEGLIEGIKKWLAGKKTYGKIDKEKVLNLTELLEKIDDMKKAVYEYREMDACRYLKELLEMHVPMTSDSMDATYRETLDGIYKLVSDYDMNKAYDAAEKLEEDIRRM